MKAGEGRATAESGIAPEGSVRLRLTVAYDGAGYAGWQVQRTGIGVQQRVEEALQRLFPGSGRVHGSSRTDTGVHARAMETHVDVPKAGMRIPPRKMMLALNSFLPEDIRVMRARICRGPFHARFDAVGKQYRYFVWNHPALDPWYRRQAWHVPRPLDLRRVRDAARRFVGTHDFRSFANNRNYELENTVRTVRRCEVRRSGALWTVVIDGDGFLYKMCRGMVGTLVQVGLGRIEPEEIERMLASRDRRVAGMTAPAQGLVLWRVWYGSRRGASGS